MVRKENALKEKILTNAAERSGLVRSPEFQKTLKEYRERKKQEEDEFKKQLLLRDYLRD